MFDELLRLTVPELRDVDRFLFTVPLLLLVLDLLRLTVPELRDVDRFLFTVPELLVVDRFLFTVPLSLVDDPLRLRTVDEERVRLTVDLVRFTRSVRAEDRTFVLAELPLTLASFRVLLVTFDLLRDDRALVLGLYVLEGLFTTVFA